MTQWINLGKAVGPQGPQGIPGLPGLQGPQGNQGAPGNTGPQGPAGLQGIQGPAGPQGAVGNDGPAGAQGLDGLQGIKGDQGIQGPQGIPGPHGLVGPQGIQGIAGPVGPEGPQGLSGTATVLVGSFSHNNFTTLPPDGFIPADWDAPNEPPNDIQMLQGQSLLYLPTGDIYVFVGQQSSPTGWINLGGVQGAPGAEGPQGEPGLQGPVGPQGEPGLGFDEAPEDNTTYGRNNAAWVNVLPIVGGTLTGALTLAADPVSNLEAATKQYVDTYGFPEAPQDAYAYGRVNGAWQRVLPLVGGILSGPLSGTTLNMSGNITGATISGATISGTTISAVSGTMTGIVLPMSNDNTIPNTAWVNTYVANAIANAVIDCGTY